jgi:hypothetical protein
LTVSYLIIAFDQSTVAPVSTAPAFDPTTFPISKTLSGQNIETHHFPDIYGLTISLASA